MPFYVVGKHVFIIGLHSGMESITLTSKSLLHEYGRQNFDLEGRHLIANESGQANVKMMRKSIGINFIQTH